MNQPLLTKKQQALLDEALKYTQLERQQARELSEWGDAFAALWEKRLREQEVAQTSEPKSCFFKLVLI